MLTCLAFSKKRIQFSPEQGRDIKYCEERQFYWLERTLITTDCKQTTVSLLLLSSSALHVSSPFMACCLDSQKEFQEAGFNADSRYSS